MEIINFQQEQRKNKQEGKTKPNTLKKVFVAIQSFIFITAKRLRDLTGKHINLT